MMNINLIKNIFYQDDSFILVSKKYNLSIRNYLAVFFLCILFGCSSHQKKDQDFAPQHPVDWTQVKPVKPKKENRSAYGNPESYEVFGVTYKLLPSSSKYKQKGVASWYGSKFHGRRTSSGETYDMLQLTAAHKTLPIPCYVKVSNLDNGKSIIVRVNDRGPFVKSRIIDLSYVAAHKIGMTEKGTANVVVESIDFISEPSSNARSKQNIPVSPRSVKIAAASSDQQGQYRFVQVGAYSNSENAKKLAKVLDREIKLPVTLSSIKRGGKMLYRVRIGPIKSLKLAEKLAKTLDIKELGKPRIVYQD